MGEEIYIYMYNGSGYWHFLKFGGFRRGLGCWIRLIDCKVF